MGQVKYMNWVACFHNCTFVYLPDFTRFSFEVNFLTGPVDKKDKKEPQASFSLRSLFNAGITKVGQVSKSSRGESCIFVNLRFYEKSSKIPHEIEKNATCPESTYVL